MFDTVEKRAATIGPGMPFRLTLPWASGTIDEEARAHVCGVYALDLETVQAHGPFKWAALSSYSPGLSHTTDYVPGLRTGQLAAGQ